MLITRPTTLFAASVLLSCLLAPQAIAAPTFPAAGRVGLEPPPGMSMSKRFAGFEDSSQTASILIAEMPGIAYTKLKEGFTDAALATRGFEVSQHKDSVVPGVNSFMAVGTQKGHGQTFDKWVLVAGNDEVTAVVTVQIPVTEKKAFPVAAIEAALHSVVLGKENTLDEKIAALPFRTKDLGGLRVSNVLAGSGLMLTLGPKDIVVGMEQPMVIVASSLGPPPEADKREMFAAKGLMTLSGVKDVEAEEMSFYKKGDKTWHRMKAHAIDAKTGEPAHVVQLIHFLPTGWIRAVGIVRPQDAKTLDETVQTVFESTEMK